MKRKVEATDLDDVPRKEEKPPKKRKVAPSTPKTPIENFRQHINVAIKALEGTNQKSVQIYHHNDCDGLTSGSILKHCFESKNFNIEKFASLEKPYPPILKVILQQQNKVIIFTDICGRIADYISTLNNGKNLVLILDHHVASIPTDKMVFNLDCDLHDIKGDRDMTASVVCYTFAEEFIGKRNAEKLSLIALTGAIGDGFFVNGLLHGENKRIFDICERNGLASYSTIEKTYINSLGEPISNTCSGLDILGGVGYFSNGPIIGVKFLLDKKDTCSLSKEQSPHVFEQLEKFKKLKDDIFKKTRANLSKLSYKKGDILMIDVGETFFPMGVKMIGVFLNDLSKEDRDEYKRMYLFGSQSVPGKIPGFTGVELPQEMQKISGRLGSLMKLAVDHGRRMPLDLLMTNGAYVIEGGFADACHPSAAAVVIDKKSNVVKYVDQCVKILNGGMGVGVGAGFGKTILCGGDCGFLMWGVNGIVGSLPFETICLIEPARQEDLKKHQKIFSERGWICFDKRMEVPGYKKSKEKMQLKAIELQIDHWNLSDRIKKNPIIITFRGTLLGASGDGASAAHCVSLANALNMTYNLRYDDYKINHSGWIGEHAFHGKPSGVDNTVSTFGGLIDISFNRKTQKSKFEKVNVKPIQIVLAHSGVHADTSSLLGICTKMREENSQKFDSQIEKIKSDVKKMRMCFERSDWKNLGKTMNENHKTIIEMGLSNERVIELCEIGMKGTREKKN